MRTATLVLIVTLITSACSGTGAPPAPSVTEVPNPAPAGARYPHVTSGSGADAVLVSWLEPGAGVESAGETRLVWASFDGQDWSMPEAVVAGEGFFVNWADFPSVVGPAEAPLAAHWLQSVPGGTYAYHVNMAFRSAPGAWSQPFTPHADRSPTEHGFVSMIPLDGGRVFVAWLDGHQTGGAGHGGEDGHDAPAATLATAMTLRSAVIHRDGSSHDEQQVDAAVCDCCQTSLARSGNRIIAVYRDRRPGEIRDISRAVYDLDQGRWSEPVFHSKEGWEIAGCPVNGPQIAASGTTVITTWFTAANGQPASFMSVSSDGGETFGAPQPLDTGGAAGRVGVAFSDDGSALLTWVGSLGGQSRVLGRLWRESALGEVFAIGEIDASRASGFPRAAGLGQGFVVAWTEPQPEARVRTFRVTSAQP